MQLQIFINFDLQSFLEPVPFFLPCLKHFLLGLRQGLSPYAVGYECLVDTKVQSDEKFGFYSKCHGKSWRSFKQ